MAKITLTEQQSLELRKWLTEVRRHGIAMTKAAERALDALDNAVVQSEHRPGFTIPGPSETK